MNGVVLIPARRLHPIKRFVDLFKDDTLDAVRYCLMFFQAIAHRWAVSVFRVR
jgi:hypothetical protein